MKRDTNFVSEIIKINRIDLTRFTNGAHGRFGTETLAALEANELVMGEFPLLMAKYREAVVQEEAVLVPYKGSTLTKQINESKDKMTAAWSHFKAGLRYYAGCEVPAKKAAGEVMLKWLKDYEFEVSAQIDRIIGLLQNFIFDCESKLLVQIRTLEMEAELAEVKRLCNETNELLTARDKEMATFEKGRVLAARTNTDSVWKQVVEAINGWIVGKGASGVEDLVGFLNSYILRETRDAFKQKVSAPSASPSNPDAGLPNTPETDTTNPPTTPPTEEDLNTDDDYGFDEDLK